MSAKQQKHVKKEKVYIYGKHALSEALLNTPQAIRKVFLSPSQKDTHLLELIAKAKIPLAPLKENGESRVGKDAVHQGVIGVLDTTSLLTPFNDFIKTIDTKKSPALVILGEVQDPHNVGAIIRSAAAFGISGILIPEHNQVGITGTVVKTSAGMAFRIPLISIGNVNNTVRTLKDIGFWVYGLEMNGKNPLMEERFSEPSLFIMGNEASGIRKKTLELCDVSLSIKMHPRCESLNVAASAAVVFYAWSTQHIDVL
ncbi:23S rRNA (guanosine(2251)-2'-O)-methyltransferase [hydrothermal vent metagenome]|uniref:23S rRNA (Guanosine(2251)-2'-O)-methyltransferase n=1 Tax=hydrothermal vent metagenome TaxID=652676 RepID=A0A3B0UTV6_9ZZZZ